MPYAISTEFNFMKLVRNPEGSCRHEPEVCQIVGSSSQVARDILGISF